KLVDLVRVVSLVLPVVHEAEGTLDAAVGADVVAQRVEASHPADLRHAVLLGEDSQPNTGLGDERFADGKAGMAQLLDEKRLDPMFGEYASQDRSANAGSQDCDIVHWAATRGSNVGHAFTLFSPTASVGAVGALA